MEKEKEREGKGEEENEKWGSRGRQGGREGWSEYMRKENSRSFGACVSASCVFQSRHNWCVYKAQWLLLLNYWRGGEGGRGRRGGGGGGGGEGV